MDGHETILPQQHFLKGMDAAQLSAISGCATYVRFGKGDFLFREGEHARHFYIISSGTVALEIFSPGREPIIVGTLDEGNVLGWSWLFEPYKWHFDAVAQSEVSVVAFDAGCLRSLCEADHDLGYELMKRFAKVIMERLQATRLALMDLYAPAYSAESVEIAGPRASKPANARR